MNQKQKRQRRKSRTLIGAILAFLGINAYDKETGALGCTPLGIAAVSTVAVVAAAVVVIGPVAHIVPPFNQPASGKQASIQTTVSTPSPLPVTSNSITVTFAGELSGPFASTSFNSCGASSGAYKIDADGTIGSVNYKVVVEMDSYSGPGDYFTNSSSGITGFSVQPIAPSDGWTSLGQPGQITVNSDGKSGSLSVSLISAGETQPATQVKGNWTCV